MPRPTPPLSAPARLVGLASLALTCACAARPGPPPLEVVTDHYTGSILSGPVVAVEESALAIAGEPWAVELRIAYLDRPPGGGGVVAEPLAAAARTVFVDSSEPLRARGQLAAGSLRLEGVSPTQGAAWEERRFEALLAGTTARFRFEPTGKGKDPPVTPWQLLDLQISARADSIELGLAFEGLVVPPVDDDQDPDDVPDLTPVYQREHVILEPQPPPEEVPLRFFFPAPRERSWRGGFLAELYVYRPRGPQPELDEAVRRAEANLVFTRELARHRARGVTAQEIGFLERGSAFSALRDPQFRRPALVFLADAAGAPATADLALVADDETLVEYIACVHAKVLEDADAAAEAASLGWLLESETYAYLARNAGDDPARGLAPELRSIQLRRTGELALFPDIVLEALAQAGAVADLEDRIARENQLFLEDPHPAARLRAFEWLQRRGLEPADYDPLGPVEARREALAAAERAKEERAEEERAKEARAEEERVEEESEP